MVAGLPVAGLLHHLPRWVRVELHHLEAVLLGLKLLVVDFLALPTICAAFKPWL